MDDLVRDPTNLEAVRILLSLWVYHRTFVWVTAALNTAEERIFASVAIFCIPVVALGVAAGLWIWPKGFWVMRLLGE